MTFLCNQEVNKNMMNISEQYYKPWERRNYMLSSVSVNFGWIVCHFWYVIPKDVVLVDPHKVEAVAGWNQPTIIS